MHIQRFLLMKNNYLRSLSQQNLLNFGSHADPKDPLLRPLMQDLLCDLASLQQQPEYPYRDFQKLFF